MRNQNIIFKGTKDGVIVKVSADSNLETIVRAIKSKISKTGDFFKNANIYMDFSESCIGRTQEEKVKELLASEYGMSIQSIRKTSIEENKGKIFNGIHEGRTRFVNNTIRSGQNQEFSGNIVIIGDVNAGGEVKAGGNIVVIGALRGVVHAGASGNEKALIAAFLLQPTQLRIAGIISRPPDGDSVIHRYPELARVKGNNIIIEPYAPNKFI